jgi:hypothetical protein
MGSFEHMVKRLYQLADIIKGACKLSPTPLMQQEEGAGSFDDGS